VEAVDPDPEDLTLRYYADLSGLPPGHGASFDEGSRTLSWTPGAGKARATPYAVVFTAEDPHGAKAVTTVQLTILPNRAPQLAAIGPLSIDENSVTELPLRFADSDPGQQLRLCKMSGPDWGVVTGEGLSPGTHQGLLKLSPGANDAGLYALTVRLIDGGTCGFPYGSYEETVRIRVQSTNSPPLIAAVGPRTVAESGFKEVLLSVTDPDLNQVLRFCKAEGPAWARVSGEGSSPGPVQGRLRLSPGPNDRGTYTVKVKVSDSGSCQGAGALISVPIDVTETNSLPVAEPVGNVVGLF